MIRVKKFRRTALITRTHVTACAAPSEKYPLEQAKQYCERKVLFKGIKWTGQREDEL